MNSRTSLVFAFSLLAFISGANAQSSPEAEAYLKTADEHYRNARQDDAIVSYEKAAGEFQRLGNVDRFAYSFNQIGVILTTPPSRSQDGFRNYTGKGRQTRWQYRRDQHRLVEAMIKRYAGREGEHIFLVPAYLNLDTERHFPTWTARANARATTQATRVNDGAHPSDEGYFQIADSIYCWLKAVAPTR